MKLDTLQKMCKELKISLQFRIRIDENGDLVEPTHIGDFFITKEDIIRIVEYLDVDRVNKVRSGNTSTYLDYEFKYDDTTFHFYMVDKCKIKGYDERTVIERIPIVDCG